MPPAPIAVASFRAADGSHVVAHDGAALDRRAGEHDAEAVDEAALRLRDDVGRHARAESVFVMNAVSASVVPLMADFSAAGDFVSALLGARASIARGAYDAPAAPAATQRKNAFLVMRMHAPSNDETTK